MARRNERTRLANRAPGQPVIRVGLTVTETQLTELQARADAARVTVPRLCVEAALGEPSGVRRADTLALLGAVDRLARVGNNLNQAVNLAHENRLREWGTEAELRDLLADVQGATDEARAALARRRAG